VFCLRISMKSRIFVAICLLAGHARATDAGAPPSYAAEIEAWRAEREARMRAPDGWLAVVGLTWLKQGPNRFGSAGDDDVILPAAAPPHAGSLVLDGHAVRLVVPPGSPVKLNGAAPAARALRTDASATPDVLAVGTVSWEIIERGARFGVRVRDKASPLRTAWVGSSWFPINRAYRVVARLQPRAGSTEIVVPDASGGKQTLQSPGTLIFTLLGKPQRLDPMLDGDDTGDQLIVFRDLTSGRETYGGGRFVRARRQADGTFVIDFNRAYSPPCAFTPYATCPLPPQQNRLRVGIAAGERTRPDASRNAHR
jgi:uncharacterized protein (DUF1684 family)